MSISISKFSSNLLTFNLFFQFKDVIIKNVVKEHVIYKRKTKK